jgi:hypothetical protein
MVGEAVAMICVGAAVTIGAKTVIYPGIVEVLWPPAFTAVRLTAYVPAVV